MSDVAGLTCMNGLQPFESTIEQTTETMPPSPKTITAATVIKQKQLTTAATLVPNSLPSPRRNSRIPDARY